MSTPEAPSFWDVTWEKTKVILTWISHKLVAPGAALLLVVAGVILAAMGAKELQIGGILGRLLGGKDSDGKAIDVANSVDPQRIDPKGKLIQPGTPDSKGDTQVLVVPIQSPGLFSDPSSVTFIPPGQDKSIKIDLPDGVTNKDVEHVVVVKPSVYAVTVKDGTNVPAQRIDDLLAKYSS